MKSEVFQVWLCEPHPIFTIAKIVKRDDYSGERELFTACFYEIYYRNFYRMMVYAF